MRTAGSAQNDNKLATRMVMLRNVLILWLLFLMACSGEARFQSYCTPAGTKRRYVSTQIRLATTAQEFAADFDGDQKSENKLSSLSLLFDGIASSGNSTLNDVINRNLSTNGLGLLLFEIQADETIPGCGAISVAMGRTTDGMAPRFDGTDHARIELGHRLTMLPAVGTSSQLESTPYSRLTSREARRINLLLPVHSSVLHLSLYGAYISIKKTDDMHIEGQINGVIRKSEIDQTLVPFLTRETTSALNESPNSSLLKMRVPFVEVPGSAVSEKKCQQPERCCRSNPSTCKFMPAEFRSLLAQSEYADPDVQVFEGSDWKPVPGGEDKNGFSVGIGFRAVAADFSPSCASDSFCQVQQLPNRDISSRAAWASRMSDAWMLTGDGGFLHFDGLNWRTEYENPIMKGSSAMGGRSYDDIWSSVFKTNSTVTMIHWDGAFWNESPAPSQSTFRAFVPDGEKGFLAVGTDGPTLGIGGGIFQYDGETWSIVDKTDRQQYNDVVSFPSGEAWAVGVSNFLGMSSVRSAGNWRPALTLPMIKSFEFRAVYGSSPENIWGLGSRSAAMAECSLFDGSKWTSMGSCTEKFRSPIRTVYASGPDDIWAATEDGHIARHRSSTSNDDWQSLDARPDSGKYLTYLVFGAERDVVWMPLSSSVLMRYQP